MSLKIRSPKTRVSNRWNGYLLIVACLLILPSCKQGGGGSGGGAGAAAGGAGRSGSGSIVLAITSPTTNATVRSSSLVLRWNATVSGTNLRAVNPYLVNVYSQADCRGAVVSSANASSNQYTFPNILDLRTYSFGVIAYDDSGSPTTEVCSAAITGNGVVSLLQVNASSFYLAIDVDFTNKLAYLGANYGGTLADVIDFTNESSPTLFRTIGTASNPASNFTYSRGVSLYNNGKRLLIASDGNSAAELFDLTANPRTGTWTKLDSMGGLLNFRKIAKVENVSATQTRVYAALRRGIALLDISEPTGTFFLTASKTSVGGNCFGNGAIIANTWMISGCYDNGSDIHLINLATLNSDLLIANPDPGSSTNIWTSAVSADGSKIFVGGVVGHFLSYSAADNPVVQDRYRAIFGSTVRDAVFTTENGKTMLYTALGGGIVDKWDMRNVAAPIHVGQISLRAAGATVELYGIRVDTATHRGYIATSGGQFIIIDTNMLAPPTAAYLTY